MKFTKYFSFLALPIALGLVSCVDDLNVKPTDPDLITEITSADEYVGLLARAYGGLVQEGGISVDDGGAGVYTRQLFNQQELTTDECVINKNWNDNGLDELVYAQPSPNNHWVYEMYSRINYQIALCNAFLREKPQEDWFSSSEVEEMKAEARVLRDLSYYHMIDLFGRGPWTDENSEIGETPPTYSREELYNAVIEDLIANVPLLRPAAQQPYGRVSREAGYALLAKMYLNAEVYIGTAAWEQCAEACQEILKTQTNGLAPVYKFLFCATNNELVACQENGGQGEILWTVPQDEITMQTYGGTTYLSGGSYATDASDYTDLKYIDENGEEQTLPNTAVYGLMASVWNGPHMRPETVNNFEQSDSRALFYEGGFIVDLENIDKWGEAGTCGVECIKFVYTPQDDYYNEYEGEGNKYSSDWQYKGPGLGNHAAPDIFNSTDFPIFRLADIYLMLAECEMNGVSCDGLKYYQAVRARAGVSQPTYLPDARGLLDERNRELYWEGHRRSDMIRLGFYAGQNSYSWQWKAGVYEGGVLPAYHNLMPIPTQFTPTLGQNPGY